MVQRGWTFNHSLWREIWTRLGTATWRRQPLSIDIARRIPATGGVYAICTHGSIGPKMGGLLRELYNAIYVGQATNLRSRFKDHCHGYGDVRPARLVFRQLDFWFTETNDLDDLEQLLMDTLGPPANRRNVLSARIGLPVDARSGRK